MNSRIGGKDICCPHCKEKVSISFNHTMEDKHLDEIQESLEIEGYD